VSETKEGRKPVRIPVEIKTDMAPFIHQRTSDMCDKKYNSPFFFLSHLFLLSGSGTVNTTLKHKIIVAPDALKK
jgi:hypothetical protein